MRSARFWKLWVWNWILFPSILCAQTAETSTIRTVELQRAGQQLNVYLFFNSLPVYEIYENLDKEVLLFKFKNTKVGFRNGQQEQLYNDPILEGIRFSEENNEMWAQFKLRTADLAFSIEPDAEPGVLIVEFHRKIEVEPLDSPPAAPTLKLTAVRFSNRPPDFSRATFFFEKSKEPRMFFRQDKDRKETTIRFSDTYPADNLEIPPYQDVRIRFDKIETDVNQTFITIDSTTGPLEVKEMFRLDPPRWIIDFFGEPGQAPPEPLVTVPEEEMTEEQKAAAAEAEQKAQRERIALARRSNAVRELYNLGERELLEGRDDPALSLFLEAYRLGKSQQAQFGDDLDALAMQALFRQADTIYKMLERENAPNYHPAITAYETAIRVAEANNFESDLLPHAYLQVGQSYRRMQFYDDANQTFDILQKKFPNTLEAAEANFWRAVGLVDQREWQRAIDSFREYLRAGASPKHLAAAHYKMAEAFYQLGRFAKAREGFERARSIDRNYPESDPTLLFHMGETYYEMADFATAREVFTTLLEKYPQADFSKLVALRLGDFLRDEGKEEEAIEVYLQAATSFKPELAVLAQMRIANILAQRPYSQDYQEALEIYESIINLRGDSPLKEEALLRKGLTLTAFGRYQEAIQALEVFAETFPNNRYVQRGVIQENIDENLKGLVDSFFQRNNYLGIVGVYEDFKKQYFSDFPFDITLFQIGVAYQALGLFNEALQVLESLTGRAESPLQELGNFQEALVLAEKGDVEASKEALIRFILQYPDSPYNADANKQLAEVYKQGREYLEAIEVYEQTIRQYAQEGGNNLLRAEVVPELYYELGNLYNELGRHANAEEAYRQVPQNFFHPVVGEIGKEVPFYVALSYFLKADMLFEMRRDREALEGYQNAIALYAESTHPDIVERIHWAQYKMGIIYQREGQEQKALAIFKELMEQEGNPLWKRLATENHDLLMRQLAYEDYLRE